MIMKVLQLSSHAVTAAAAAVAVDTVAALHSCHACIGLAAADHQLFCSFPYFYLPA